MEPTLLLAQGIDLLLHCRLWSCGWALALCSLAGGVIHLLGKFPKEILLQCLAGMVRFSTSSHSNQVL